jgi:hypothetical protein
VLGEGGVDDGRAVAEALPQLLRDVRREGREHPHEPVGCRAWRPRTGVGADGGDELHQRADRRVEVQALDVAAHGVRRPAQGRARAAATAAAR